MEFSITSVTFKRYVAGSKAYCGFFDTYWYDTQNIGFCSMMRTIYFWRPLIAFLRLFFMAIPVAVVIALVYTHFAQAVAGNIAALVISAAIFAGVKAASATIIVIKKREWGEVQFGLLGEWAKTAHDKVCPLVTFTHEDGDNNV